MFSRNRFNGQHGTGVTPKGATKAKVHSPKKRAPNPKVALVIRGKIHRLLQGSTDQHVPDSHLDYAGIEETEGETQEGRNEHRNVYHKVSPRAEGYSVSNGKGHTVPSGPPCIGEVELNREGYKRIPCTLQHKSRRPPASLKRIRFGEVRAAPAEMRVPLHYSAIGPDMNGTKFAGAAGRDIASPCIRPKRPYSTGDCVDYNFNRTLPGILLEEDEEKEEESSAVIEHILKELRGINKIQEEISDLRDYLSSVRGSVEEVSSCVDAVLLEIEGIRSSNKAGLGEHAGTWSGVGCNDGQSPRKRPSSAYGSLGNVMPKTQSNFFARVGRECHSIQGELIIPVAEASTVSTIAELVDHQEPELEIDEEDTSDHSSDIPVGAIATKLSFGYQDGQDCPSTSSLSSVHSSKSELDLKGPICSNGSKQQRADDRDEHWPNAGPSHSASGESMWRSETAYLMGRGLEEHEDERTLCCEGAGSWDDCRNSGGYAISGQCSTESSETFSVRSGKHYNSPASTSSRDDWQSRRRRPQSQSGIHVPRHTNFEPPSVGYDCNAKLSYAQNAGYHSVDGHDSKTEALDYGQSNELSYTTDSQVDTNQENYLIYEDSSAAAWTDASLCTTVAYLGRPFIQESDVTSQSLENKLPPPGSADIQAGGFNVKRISQAVLDFSSALRGALRKLDVPGAQNPGEETDVEMPMPYDLPLSCEAQFEQTSDKIQKGDVIDYSTSVGELRNNNTHSQFADPMLEANKGLTSKSTDNCQQLTCSDRIPPCPKERSVCTEAVTSSTGKLPPPDDLTEKPIKDHVEGSTECTTDMTLAARVPQYPTAETHLFSHLAEEPAAPEKQGQNEMLQQPSTEIVASTRKEDPLEPPAELSQMDEHKLKCLRTFQQILREKREIRRSLASVTMSTFSKDDFEAGSCHWILS